MTDNVILWFHHLNTNIHTETFLRTIKLKEFEL